MSNLSLADSKISEIIDALLLHHESEAPPENYRELGEHLVRFKLQNSPDSLELMDLMINTFEANREELEEDSEFFDESGGEPDNGNFSEGEEFIEYSSEPEFLREDEDAVFYAIEDKVEELICMVKGSEDRRYRCLCIALIFHQNDLLQSQMPEWKTIEESEQPSTEEFTDFEGSENLWGGNPEETGGAYAGDESFLAEFGDGLPDNEAEYLSFRYSLKYGRESLRCSSVPPTAVEQRYL